MAGQQRGPINGNDPLIYTGGLPNLVVMNREPAPTDYQEFVLGHWWIIPVEYSDNGTGEVWVLVSKRYGIATWKRLHGGGGPPPIQGLAINTLYFTTPGAGTYTPTIGMTQCYVECVGGGGGGAGNHAPGAGAGYTAKLYTAKQIGISQAFSIGVGGVAKIGTPGNSGGDTTFSSSSLLMTAGGGQGSSAYSTSLGGTATGGDLNIPGQSISNGAGGYTLGYNGGASFYAFGGLVYADGTGNHITAGGFPGGGGTGSPNAPGPDLTSNGGNGFIKVTEYLA